MVHRWSGRPSEGPETVQRQNIKYKKGIQDWDPAQWARLFRKAGAKYVVLTSKHHDGYTLWPSRVPNPYRDESQTELSRDIVGELGVAIRHAGLKYGLYYSGGLDFSFPDTLNGTCKACKYRPRKPQEGFNDFFYSRKIMTETVKEDRSIY